MQSEYSTRYLYYKIQSFRKIELNKCNWHFSALIQPKSIFSYYYCFNVDLLVLVVRTLDIGHNLWNYFWFRIISVEDILIEIIKILSISYIELLDDCQIYYFWKCFNFHFDYVNPGAVTLYARYRSYFFINRYLFKARNGTVKEIVQHLECNPPRKFGRYFI